MTEQDISRGLVVRLNIPAARPIRLLSGVLHEAHHTYKVLGWHASLVRLSRVGDCEKIMVLPSDVVPVTPAPAAKNTNPRALDATNIGDNVVLRMPDGSTRSAVVLTVFASGQRAVFGWKTSPRASASVTLQAHEWRDEGRVEAIFPTGCMFLELPAKK